MKTDGSHVALCWGIQVKTMPLLLAVEAHERSEPARLFFSLLRLRARSSTLVCTSSPSHRLTIASLPSEIIDEVLDQFFHSLFPDAKRAMVEQVGECECQRQFATEHACGIDCPSWLECCGWPEDDDRDIEEYWDRRSRFSAELKSIYIPKITSFLSLLHLDLVTSPFLSRDWTIPTKQPGDLSNVVVGIPFLHSRNPYTTPQDPNTLITHHEPWDGTGDWDVVAAESVAGSFKLSLEERRRFKRLTRALGLEDQLEDVGSLVAEKAPMDIRSTVVATKPKEEDLGSSSLCRPSMMLVHKSWARWN